MKVIFSHGKESGPWGSKITRLADAAKDMDFSVDSIGYPKDHDADLRVEQLLNELKNQEDNFLLVGSSMGAYVSLVASEQVDAQGVFLLAPALYMPGYQKQSYDSKCCNIEIVHGWSDDVIPVENSIKYAKEIQCSLHLLDGDHRLNSSLDVVEVLFREFLKGMQV